MRLPLPSQCPSGGLALGCEYPFLCGGSRLDSVCETQPHNCWAGVNNHFSWHSGCALGNAAWCTASLPHRWGVRLTHINCHPPWLLTLFLHWCYPGIWSPSCTDNGVNSSPGRNPGRFWNLRRFLSAHPCWGSSKWHTHLSACPALTLKLLWLENQVFAIEKQGASWGC